MKPHAPAPPAHCNAHTADGICGRWRQPGQPWCDRCEPDIRRHLRNDRDALDHAYRDHLRRVA